MLSQNHKAFQFPKAPARPQPRPGEGDYDYGVRVGRWMRRNEFAITVDGMLREGDRYRCQFTPEQCCTLVLAFAQACGAEAYVNSRKVVASKTVRRRKAVQR